MKKDLALFFDIDGTLRIPNTGKIPESAFEEIQKWQDLGYPCCIATGRCVSNAMKQGIDKHHWDGIIGANGQEIIGASGNVIASHMVPKDTVKQAVKYIKENNMALYLITNEDWVRIGEINEDMKIAQALFGGDFPEEGEYTGQDVIYMIAFGNKDEDYAIYERLGLRAVATYFHYADVVLPGFDKAKGIKTYLEHENIHHYYAFGDSGNDLEMLENADYAVVMGNGDKDMFKYADKIADDVAHDGLAKALRELRERLNYENN